MEPFASPGAGSFLHKQNLIEDELDVFQRQARPRVDHVPQDVAAVLQDIHLHLFEASLTVASLRRRLKLRNNNISTRFRCTTGLGIREYIESMRMKAARRLLKTPELEVYLIAMAVGYDHQETFCRAFQRRTGLTASEFRARRSGGSS